MSVEKAFGRMKLMKPTFIVKCTQCGGLMLSTQGQKTKICPYCGAHVNLLKAQRVASATNSFEASIILRRIKSEEGFTSKP
jgi:DNA-directed RNA polymerase subunit RPC12/RpoP